MVFHLMFSTVLSPCTGSSRGQHAAHPYSASLLTRHAPGITTVWILVRWAAWFIRLARPRVIFRLSVNKQLCEGVTEMFWHQTHPACAHWGAAHPNAQLAGAYPGTTPVLLWSYCCRSRTMPQLWRQPPVPPTPCAPKHCWHPFVVLCWGTAPPLGLMGLMVRVGPGLSTCPISTYLGNGFQVAKQVVILAEPI